MRVLAQETELLRRLQVAKAPGNINLPKRPDVLNRIEQLKQLMQLILATNGTVKIANNNLGLNRYQCALDVYMANEGLGAAKIRLSPYGRNDKKYDKHGPFDDGRHSFSVPPKGFSPQTQAAIGLEMCPFTEPDVIRLIHGLSSEVACNVAKVVKPEQLASAWNFLDRFENQNRASVKMADFQAYRLTECIEYLSQIQKVITNLEYDFECCSSLFPKGDLDVLLQQAEQLITLLKNMKTETDTGTQTQTVIVPRKEVKNLPGEYKDDDLNLATEYDSAAHAKASVLKKLGLENHLKQFIVLGHLLEYARLAKESDEYHYGTYPRVVDGDSFYCRFEGLCHGGMVRRRKNIEINHWLESSEAGEWLKLLADVELVYVSKQGGIRWQEGTCWNLIKAVLSSKNAPADIIHKFFIYYNEQRGQIFRPQPYFELGTPGNEFLIIHAPNGSGKSTLIRTFIIALHLAMQGRKVPAMFAELTPPDYVHCNLNVHDTDKISQLEAQLRDMEKFMKNSTTRSVGVFQDPFETAPGHSLALMIACQKWFVKNGRRGMFISQMPEAEQYANPDGWKSLHGRFKRNESERRSTFFGVNTFSLNASGELSLPQNAYLNGVEKARGVLPVEVYEDAKKILAHLEGREKMKFSELEIAI